MIPSAPRSRAFLIGDFLGARYPHQARHAIADGLEDRQDLARLQRSVLAVDEEPVEADVGEDLGDGGQGERDHGADQGFGGPQAFPEIADHATAPLYLGSPVHDSITVSKPLHRRSRSDMRGPVSTHLESPRRRSEIGLPGTIGGIVFGNGSRASRPKYGEQVQAMQGAGSGADRGPPVADRLAVERASARQDGAQGDATGLFCDRRFAQRRTHVGTRAP